MALQWPTSMDWLVTMVSTGAGYTVCSQAVTNSGSHYYLALLKPVDYHVEGCDHDDVQLSSILATSTAMYQANLHDIIATPNTTQYKSNILTPAYPSWVSSSDFQCVLHSASLHVLDWISCTLGPSISQTSLSIYGVAHLIVTRVIVAAHGTGLYCRVIHGKYMAKSLWQQHPICLVHLTAHLVIQPKR